MFKEKVKDFTKNFNESLKKKDVDIYLITKEYYELLKETVNEERLNQMIINRIDKDLLPKEFKIEEIFNKSKNLEKEELEKTEVELKDEREGHDHAKGRIAKAEEAFSSQKEKIENQKKEIEELHIRLKQEFENIANKVLRQNSEEISKINALASSLGKAMKGTDKDSILKGMDDLDDYSKPMAERVMDASISEAMKGKKML